LIPDASVRNILKETVIYFFAIFLCLYLQPSMPPVASESTLGKVSHAVIVLIIFPSFTKVVCAFKWIYQCGTFFSCICEVF